MVHALKQAHRMLNPNGLVISAQYLAAPCVIEVLSPETTQMVGWMLDRDEFLYELSAFNALAQVVADRDYFLEDERDIDHNFYVDGLRELLDWLGESWESAVLPETTLERLEASMRSAGSSARIRLA